MARAILPNLKMYYECQGSGEPLLFLHGLGASTWTWEQQVAHFTSDFQVWTLDMRGHGRSSKPSAPYSIEMMAQDVIDFIEYQELIEVNLVGLSMGGIVAFQVALMRPDLTRSLCIVNAGPEIKADNWQTGMLIWQREWWMTFMSMEAIARGLAWKLFPETKQAPIRQKFIYNWSRNDKTAYQQAFHAMVKWRGSDEVDKIVCPTCFITTPNDYTPVAMKETYAQRMPLGQVKVVEDSRHVTPLDQPERFNHVLREFLEEAVLELA